MKSISIINNDTFNQNIKTIQKMLSLEVLENIEVTSLKSNNVGFKIEKNQSKITIYYSSNNYFYNAMAYVFMSLDKHTYIYENKASIQNMGIMLDVARNAVPKVDTIKTYIQIMALMGYNYLELYVEDVFEVLDEPQIGYMRGKYSIQVLKELDVYAASFGIEIVPCIQTLAHLERIFVHDTYAGIHDIEDVLLVGADRTYQLIENMLKTTQKAFSSRRINIGMDEAFRLGLGQYLAKNGYQTKTEIMLNHLHKVSDLLKKYGYHGMMWADMFFQMSGGNYHLDEIEITDEIIEKVPKDITLIFWEYFDTSFDKYDKKFKQIKRMTNDYAFAGGAWKWCGFTPLNKFTLKAMDVSIKACKTYHVNDYLVTAWGDDGAEASHFSILPALIYASQSFYDHKNNENIHNDFSKLLTNYTFDELITLDTANILSDSVNIDNPSKYLLYDDILMGRLDYPVSIEFQSKYEEKVVQLKKLSDHPSNYNYIFNTQYKLCKVLALKTKLTNELYDMYKSKSPKALEVLIPEFDQLLELLNDFYQSFMKQWHFENKPFGFEVQNYRLGGLIQRISYIKDLVRSYTQYEINEIEALDEKHVDKSDNKTVAFNGFIRTVTYGKM